MEQLYSVKRQELVREMENMRKHLNSVWSDQRFKEIFGVTIEEHTDQLFIGGLQHLRQRCFPPKPPDQSHHLWIGINPPPHTIDVKDLYTMTDLVCSQPKYKYLEKHSWCIEAHTDNGFRPHIHLMTIVNDEIRPNRVIKQLAAYFGLSTNAIECKLYKRGHLYDQHDMYIRGDKQESKLDNVQQDRQLREDLGVPHFISNF